MAILMTSKKKWKSPIETTVNKANKKKRSTQCFGQKPQTLHRDLLLCQIAVNLGNCFAGSWCMFGNQGEAKQFSFL